MSLGVMTIEHPRFAEFKKTLKGPGYCNFRYTEPGNPETVTWDCSATAQRSHARRLLAEMGASSQEIEKSLNYFSEHGGYCDCEIIFNMLSNAEREEWRARRNHRRQARRIASKDAKHRALCS